MTSISSARFEQNATVSYTSVAAAQPGLSVENIGRLKIPLPPLSEQEDIAQFLDHKTAQIDALIAKKEALLAKLAQKRMVLISQAVTKGLDPSVPMKDSGIEWLGEIPAHWGMVRLKHVARIQSGLTLGKKHTGEKELFYEFISANNQSGYYQPDKAVQLSDSPATVIGATTDSTDTKCRNS